MGGFNFGQIGSIASKFFDSDYVDIRRDISGQLQEVYSNIPCHIAFQSVDNPNPETVDIKPIIQSLNVHFPLWVDVRNNDFIVAKRMGNDGDLLAVYSGRCGNPIVSQGRQKVSVAMSATESESPTPVPPKNPINIYIEYVSDGEPIQDSIVRIVEQGGEFKLTAPTIIGYKAVDCEVDGELIGATAVVVGDVQESHTVRFIYEAEGVSSVFRFLVKGLYTRNDGSLANGHHLYGRIPIGLIVKDDNGYILSSKDVNVEHEDNGRKLLIDKGVKLTLVPNDEFVEVTEVMDRDGGEVLFRVAPFTPSEDERNAYPTEWYD